MTLWIIITDCLLMTEEQSSEFSKCIILEVRKVPCLSAEIWKKTYIWILLCSDWSHEPVSWQRIVQTTPGSGKKYSKCWTWCSSVGKNQKCVQNPVKHLRWSLCKTSWQLKAVYYFRKKLHWCLTGIWIRLKILA